MWPPKTRISEAQTSHSLDVGTRVSARLVVSLVLEGFLDWLFVRQLYSVERFEWSFLWGKFGDFGLRKTSNKVVGDNDAVS